MNPSVCSVPDAGVSYNTGLALQDAASFGDQATIVPIDIMTPPVLPPPATGGALDTGLLSLSIYDYGFLGNNANFAAEDNGAPFSFNGIEGGLFVSTVLVGTSAEAVITNPYDQGNVGFTAEQPVTSFTPPAPFDQGLTTAFSSNNLSGDLGGDLLVTERAYSRAGDAFAVVDQLDVQNTSDSDLNGVYVGIFADWDVIDDATIPRRMTSVGSPRTWPRLCLSTKPPNAVLRRGASCNGNVSGYSTDAYGRRRRPALRGALDDRRAGRRPGRACRCHRRRPLRHRGRCQT